MNSHVATFRPRTFGSLQKQFITAALISMFVVQEAFSDDHKNVTRETIANSYQKQFNIKLQLMLTQIQGITPNPRLSEINSEGNLTSKSAEEVTLTELISVDETDKFEIVETRVKTMNFDNGSFKKHDSARIDLAGEWGLIRASNTNQPLTLRLNDDDQGALDKIEDNASNPSRISWVLITRQKELL